jgi:hypothetical protein
MNILLADKLRYIRYGETSKAEPLIRAYTWAILEVWLLKIKTRISILSILKGPIHCIYRPNLDIWLTYLHITRRPRSKFFSANANIKQIIKGTKGEKMQGWQTGSAKRISKHMQHYGIKDTSLENRFTGLISNETQTERIRELVAR